MKIGVLLGIVVPYDQVLDVLQESHCKGTGSAIVISAGFAERGVADRRDLQGKLGAFARASGMRISGPNCLGLANVTDDIWATSSSGSDRARRPGVPKRCDGVRAVGAGGLAMALLLLLGAMASAHAQIGGGHPSSDYGR